MKFSASAAFMATFEALRKHFSQWEIARSRGWTRYVTTTT
jgi:hypothetical protein